MKPEDYHYERRAILGLIASVVATLATGVHAQSVPTMKVFKDPNCGC